MPSAAAGQEDRHRADPVLVRFVLLGYDCVVVPHDAAGASVIPPIRRIAHGGHCYPGPASPALSGPDPIERLTPRELEIAVLIASGCCNKTIARRLEISCHTVGAHVARIFAKLGVHKRTELSARIAQRLGCVTAAG